MHHFFAPGGDGGSGELMIRGQDVKHIVKVLRMKAGDQLIASDGRDRDYLCEIAETGPDFVRLRVIGDELPSAESSRRITLFQGLPKADKMDYIIEKTVELGVSEVVPVEMQRCVMRLEEGKKEKRRQRWQLKAESASKQSGRSLVPEVGPVSSFAAALKRAGELDHIIVPYESAENMEYTRQTFSAVKEGESVGFFIGPEGGFAPEEIEELKAAGAKIVTLGPRILRTETAGPAVLAMVNLLWE
ncbi:MAG: 16S rRNA (uracil(1498)-N(3))-methyltransferase [Lachnospiraceae bacterium]|nr:16S rRNA (uracil(1498)-N(3))-methyltransferase [Lachnospiraceae bacterium]